MDAGLFSGTGEGWGGILLRQGCSAHAHLLRGIDDTSVVAKLQGTQHRSSHGEHQASRHLQEKGGENKKEGLKSASQLCPPPIREVPQCFSLGSCKRRRDALKVVSTNMLDKRENLLFFMASTWAKGKNN